MVRRNLGLGIAGGVLVALLAATALGRTADRQAEIRGERGASSTRPPAAAPGRSQAWTTNPFGYRWRPVTIGGGGMVTGIDISPDGTSRIIRTDTYGVYRWTGSSWKQIVTARTMPPADRVPGNEAGALAALAAPSQPRRLYMAYRGYVYRSDDAGDSWARTAFEGAPFNANLPTRAWGPRLAVSPTDPDVVLFGTPSSGAFLTRDGGRRWQSLSVPKGGTVDSFRAGVTFVAFDPTSGRPSARMVVAPAGDGVHESLDGGLTWRRIDGGPDVVVDGAFDRGTLVVMPYQAQGSGTAPLWVHEGGTWSQRGPAGSFVGWSGALETTSLAVHPTTPGRWLLAEAGGSLWSTLDGGRSWKNHDYRSRGGDVPWLVELLGPDEGFLTVGDLRFDPVDPDRAWLTMGVGVLRLDGLSAREGRIGRTVVAGGIEQLVVSRIVAPPGGLPVLAVHDFGTFVLDVAAGTVVKGPVNRFISAWDVDYSPFVPRRLVADVTNLINESDMLAGFSDDGGRTWRQFERRPRDEPATGRNLAEVRFTGCGTMAISQPDNIVWQPTGELTDEGRVKGCFRMADGVDAIRAHGTLDGGATWFPIRLPGVEDTVENIRGFDVAYFLGRHNLVADQVRPGVFYVHHAYRGTFRSTDGGRSWELMSTTPSGDSWKFNVDLQPVPGREGHLFLTDGGSGEYREVGPTVLGGTPLYRTTDGGRQWSVVPDVDWVGKIGFGKAERQGGYPAIYLTGRVRGQMGLWRSVDDARTWKRIADFPNDNLDVVVSIDGDKDVFGRVYIGFGGSGVAVGESVDGR